MKNYYYKVLFYRAFEKTLHSASISGPASISYKLNKWTLPIIKGSKIFVFKKLSDARSFANKYEKIFKCQVQNPEIIKEALHSDSFTNNRDIPKLITFWKRFSKKQDCKTRFIIPSGTFVVDAVKLLKEVK